MSTYQVFKKQDQTEAVIMGTIDSKNYETKYLENGFTPQGYVEAESYEEALTKLGVKNEKLDRSSQTKKKEPLTIYEPRYETARSVSKMVTFFGWSLFLFGIIGVIFSVFLVSESSLTSFLVSVLPALGCLVSGLLLVASAQVTTATVDNSEHTYQILKRLQNN